MKVRALRGVCVGVERHLKPGDVTDVDDGIVTYLVSIKAVEVVKDEAAPAASAPVVDEIPETPTPAKKPSKEK